MLSIEEIKTFMVNDAGSEKKKNARIGQRYYEADHDIKKYRIFYVDGNGELKEDKLRSNIKISHPFFTENVDQVVQYVLSGEDGFVKSDDPNLQKYLDEYFNTNEDFVAELYDTLTGTVAKGFEYVYAYKNRDGKTTFQCADSIGVIEVDAKDADDKIDHVIYWYTDNIEKNTKEITRIQVWDETQTYYYIQTDEGIKLDANIQPNPRPHILYEDEGDGMEYDGLGYIPFFKLTNCKKQRSGLAPIKDLIDDYDLMACGLSNNIQDTNEALYVVKGFQGDNLDELMLNIKSKKHIGVDDDGGVEIKTVDIPYEARKAKLELDEQKIYQFGFALNTAGLKDTNATTNLAVKTAYSQLDLKATKLIIRLKQFMRKLLKVVLQEINETTGRDYQQSDVYFRFEPETPVNEQENAQIELIEAQRKQTEIGTILNLQTQLDNETMMELICEQLDIDYNDIKDRLPEPDGGDDLYKAQNALDTAQGDETGNGDVVE